MRICRWNPIFGTPQAIRVESGDHESGPAVARSVVVTFVSPVPSGATT
jgi:hypothetical protein